MIPLDEWVNATLDGLRNLAELRKVGAAARTAARRHDWSAAVEAVEQVYFGVATATASHDKGSSGDTGRITDKGYRYQQ